MFSKKDIICNINNIKEEVCRFTEVVFVIEVGINSTYIVISVGSYM